MHSSLVALASSLSVAAAVTRGFNYGAVLRDGSVKTEATFTAEFEVAKGLAGTDGAFSSARLYTMIQSGTASDPISAIPAAIATDTRLLLGLWASAGQANIDLEIAALQTAISRYGEEFTSRINGISVGSEDMYRISETGYENNPNSVGATAAEVASYITQVKSVISDAGLSIPVGHVDTWDAWGNSSNTAVAEVADFLGMNTFPYFQRTEVNSIDNASVLFNNAYDITKAAANGKPVLITETGWPVAGATSGESVPSPDNARQYYETVGCNQLFGNVDTYWYTLVDANTDTDYQPEFGVVGTTLAESPLFDLSCDATSSTSSSTSASASATSTGSSGGSNTGSGSYSTVSAPAPTGTGNAYPTGNGTVVGGSTPTPTGTGPAPTGTGFESSATHMKAFTFAAAFGAVAAFLLV